MTDSSDVEPIAQPKDWAPLVTVFTLVIGFTYSDDMVEFAQNVTGWWSSRETPWLVFALDCLLVLSTAAMKWRMGGETDPKMFLRRMATGKWGLGAALVVIMHVVLIATTGVRSQLGESASVWINLLASLVFVTAMGLLLVSALSDKADRANRSWVVPVMLGTFVAQLASALWYPVIDVENGCAGDVASSYFSDSVNMTPVILLTLGIELNYVRRNASATLNAGQRVTPLLTVIMLGVSLMLSFSMVVKADMPKCGLAAVWQEYIAFVFSAQTLSIGMATVVWLLVSNPGDRDSLQSGSRRS